MAESDEPHTIIFGHFDFPEAVNSGMTVLDFTLDFDFAASFGGRFLLKAGFAVMLYRFVAFETAAKKVGLACELTRCSFHRAMDQGG